MPTAVNAISQASFALIDANGVPRKALVPQNFAVQPLNVVLATPNTSPGGVPSLPQWTKITPAHMSGVGSSVAYNAGTVANTVLLLDADGNATAARVGLLLDPGHTGIFNVKHYGAKGDGVTDDTVAINAAVTALNAAGGGILFFPWGIYVTSGGHTFTVAARVQGLGQGYWHGQGPVQQYYNSTHFLSVVKCTSDTADLFHFSAGFSHVDNILLHNVAATRPTAGAGLCFQGPNEATRVVVRDVTCLGFYISINQHSGAFCHYNGIVVGDFVKYGMRLANESVPDWGDCVVDDIFMLGGDNTAAAGTTPADAGFRWESGGGLKASNLKFVDGMILHGIWIEPQAGVHTSQINLINISCDQIAGNAVRITSAGDGTLNYINIGHLFTETQGSAYAPIYIAPATNGAVGPVEVTDSILIDENSLDHNWAIEVAPNSGVTVISSGVVTGGHADTLYNPLGFAGNTLIDLGHSNALSGNAMIDSPLQVSKGILSGDAVGGWFGLWGGTTAPGGADYALLQNASRSFTNLNAVNEVRLCVGNTPRLSVDANYINCLQPFLPPSINTGLSPFGDKILAVDSTSNNLMFSAAGAWWKVITSEGDALVAGASTPVLISGSAIGGWAGFWAGSAAPNGNDFFFLQNAARTTTVINSTSIIDFRISNQSSPNALEIGATYIQCNNQLLLPTLNTATTAGTWAGQILFDVSAGANAHDGYIWDGTKWLRVTGTVEIRALQLDGKGAAITTGSKGGLIEIGSAGTITGYTLVAADGAGSISIDLKVGAYNAARTSITASAPCELSASDHAQDRTLTGWSKTIPAGSILEAVVLSSSYTGRVTLNLEIKR